MIVYFKMKLIFILPFFVSIFLGLAIGQRVTFVGSYFASPNVDYKTIFLTNGLRNSKFEASLHGLNKINLPNLTPQNVNKLQVVAPQEGNDGIQLELKTDKCNSKPVKLISTSNRSIVFIHFDKMVYKKGEEFKFRIFVLDNDLKPQQDYKEIDVLIFDSKNNLIRNFNSIKTTEFGIFEDSIILADEPNLGKWVIKALVGDRTVSKSFGVEKPDENGLEVAVDIPSVVAHVDKRMYITVYVKDNTEKVFVGTADVFVKAKFKNSNKNVLDQHVKTVEISGSRKIIGIDFYDDLSIRFPTADMILDVDIVVKDQATQRSITIHKTTELIYKGRNIIQVVRKEYFKPTIKFNAKVKVKLFDGQPDNSLNQLSVLVQYESKDQKITQDRSQYNLKNGEVLLNLQPKADTLKIKLELKFAEIEHVVEIKRFPGIEEYMQVNPTNKLTSSSEKATFVARATEEMELLHVIVVGTKGVLYTQEYEESIGKDIVNFEVPLSKEMKPESRGLAFYIRNGEIVYDEFSINTGFSINTTIDITSPESAKPNEVLNYEVKTEVGSKVFITAVDQNPIKLIKSNEISRTDIYNELIYYINLKFPNVSKYHFEKFNGLVFDLLWDGRCNNQLLSSTGFDDSSENDINPSNIPTSYFPEIMISDSYVAETSNSEKRRMKIPESPATWQFFGISVHPILGFTVSKTQPKITVKKELLIQLRAPVSAYDTEAFATEVRFYNPTNEQINIKGTIRIENGLIVEKTINNEFRLKCEKVNPSGLMQRQISETLLRDQTSKPLSFLIRPNGRGNVKISVTDSTTKENVEKVIKILKLGSESEVGVDKKSYGSLLDPILNGLDKIFNRPIVTDEEKMLKFGMSIITYNYFRMSQKHIEMKNALQDIVARYQEAIVILERIIPNMEPKHTWLLSMIVQNLIDAQHLITVDKTLITKSLNLIKSQQDQTGKFKYDENSDYHRNIGDKLRSEIQSALIIARMIKDETAKTSLRPLIQKTINFLKGNARSWERYPKVIAAYTLGLYDDKATAKNLLRDLEINPLSEANPESIETSSYIILAKILTGEDPQKEVKWLLSQRNDDGRFYSPYDTAIAYKALYEYNAIKNLKTLGVQATKNIKKDDIDGFNLEISEQFVSSNEAKLDLRIIYNETTFDVTNLVVVEVELPRGYRYIENNNQNRNVEKVAVQKDRGRVFFYLKKLIKNQPFTLKINVLKIFNFENHGQSVITIHDYYRSNVKSEFNYNLDKNTDNCKKISIGKKLNIEKIIAERNLEEVKESKLKLESSMKSLSSIKIDILKLIKATEETHKIHHEILHLKTEIYNAGWNVSESIDHELNEKITSETDDDSETTADNVVDDFLIPTTTATSWTPKETYESSSDANKDSAIAHNRYKSAEKTLNIIKNKIAEINEKLETAKKEVQKTSNLTVLAQNKLQTAQKSLKTNLESAKKQKNVLTELLTSAEQIRNSSVELNLSNNEYNNAILKQQQRTEIFLKNAEALYKSLDEIEKKLILLIKKIAAELNMEIQKKKSRELNERLSELKVNILSLKNNFDRENLNVKNITNMQKRLSENYKRNKDEILKQNENVKLDLEHIKTKRTEAFQAIEDSKKIIKNIQDARKENKNAQKKFRNAEKSKYLADSEAKKYNKLLMSTKRSEKDAETHLNETLATYKQLYDIFTSFTSTKNPTEETSTVKDISSSKPEDQKENSAVNNLENKGDTTASLNGSSTTITIGKESDQKTVNASSTPNPRDPEETSNDPKEKVSTESATANVSSTNKPVASEESSNKDQKIETTTQSTTIFSVKSTDLPTSSTINNDYDPPSKCDKWYRFCSFGL